MTTPSLFPLFFSLVNFLSHRWAARSRHFVFLSDLSAGPLSPLYFPNLRPPEDSRQKVSGCSYGVYHLTISRGCIGAFAHTATPRRVLVSFYCFAAISELLPAKARVARATLGFVVCMQSRIFGVRAAHVAPYRGGL